ncbi:uncharacterized protein L3040_009531 [Drepanopeziza brunnea f. sp. 'multigermtubi']|uniref:Uncharacterized protein n=1 Tax=Marssonina brunnea f. sp. multigermtubi (strain MB_m1) TaxID=1072389 RepID=K1WT49_MARBU|nr:uncharacterized protein MBM_05525 [Drepanopeziza brunnea f. sp. 'multigermtubi' MB_m1]EKD16231.1 hypothetical protein MBM_05525 [Drepanopeziza brunnea f. sp. 'multigermtubi' MB_m1]KAJ5032945.1 hypothetical protein L3040_009531 [Drepanopeziza brunnea f. sp. 'multigermtubi']
MLLPQFVCPILLAVSFLANTAYGSREVIGYRTVSQDEARYIRIYKRPFKDKAFDVRIEEYNQLGQGFYTVNEPAGWQGSVESWYCVLEADSRKIKEVKKVWIPQYYKNTKLWSLWKRNEKTILEYIRSIGVPNPRKALRFSYIKVAPQKLQMVIPTDTINNNELDITAQCWKTEGELSQYSSKTVDWKSWKIAGNPDTIPVDLYALEPDIMDLDTMNPDTVDPDTVDPDTVNPDTVDPETSRVSEAEEKVTTSWYRRLWDYWQLA